MMLIREKQLEAFQEMERLVFEKRMVKYLRKVYHEELSSLDRSTLGELIRYGIAKSKSYGILIEDEVRRYVEIMIKIGRDFDRDPQWAELCKILSDREMGSDRRLTLIEERLGETIGLSAQ